MDVLYNIKNVNHDFCTFIIIFICNLVELCFIYSWFNLFHLYFIRLTFYICSVGFSTPMLFDNMKNPYQVMMYENLRNPYHLMLQEFQRIGGIEALFKYVGAGIVIFVCLFL